MVRALLLHFSQVRGSQYQMPPSGQLTLVIVDECHTPPTRANHHPKGHFSHLFSLETTYCHSFYFCLLETSLGLITEIFIFSCWEIMFLRNWTPIIVQIRWPADRSHSLFLCRCTMLNFVSLSSVGEVSAFCFTCGCAIVSFISLRQSEWCGVWQISL